MNDNFDTEHKLWLALGNEHPNALRYMYKKYHHVWISWMVKRGGHQEDGEDIFQEALIVLIQKAKDPQFTLKVLISTFFITICKRMWYKKLERTPTTSIIDDKYDVTDNAAIEIIEEYEEKEASFRQMHAALDLLGEPCVSILRSYYIDNKSMTDIAVIYNYTNADNAKNQKYKCMSRLKKIFFRQ